MKLSPWWITGFADGESTFQISRKSNGPNHRTYAFSWRLRLRADDIRILRMMQKQLGGRLYWGKGRRKHNARRSPSDTLRANPSAEIVLYRRGELLKLVRHFDAYPLRSKKQRDYRIWREALMFWIEVSDEFKKTMHRPRKETRQVHVRMHRYFLKIKSVRVYRRVK